VSRGDSARHWHGPGRHHRGERGWPGVYLDRRWDNGGVNVTVRQTIAPAPPSYAPFLVPSINELPALAGIREVRPSQPAIYVVDDAGNSVRPVTSGLRRSSGPRILEAGPDGDWVTTTGSVGESERNSGPRIIHLAVPVGSNR
jgi:hypothetical protein